MGKESRCEVCVFVHLFVFLYFVCLWVFLFACLFVLCREAGGQAGKALIQRLSWYHVEHPFPGALPGCPPPSPAVAHAAARGAWRQRLRAHKISGPTRRCFRGGSAAPAAPPRPPVGGKGEQRGAHMGTTVPTSGVLALSVFSPPPLALSHQSGGFCPGPALTFLSSRYSMSAVL